MARYETASSGDPRPEAQVRAGWILYQLGRHADARRSLDAVIKDHPRNVRALVARAWIDYIVDTKMPWGTRWLLGRVPGLTVSGEFFQMLGVDADMGRLFTAADD